MGELLSRQQAVDPEKGLLGVGPLFLDESEVQPLDWAEYVGSVTAEIEALSGQIKSAAKGDGRCELYARRAQLYLDIDETGKAMEDLQAAQADAESQQMEAAVETLQSRVLLRTYDFQGVLEHATIATTLDPKNPAPFAERCLGYCELVQPEKGLADGHTAVRLCEEALREGRDLGVLGAKTRFRAFLSRAFARVLLGFNRPARADFITACEALRPKIFMTHDLCKFMVRWFTVIGENLSLDPEELVDMLMVFLATLSHSLPKWSYPWLMQGLSHLKRIAGKPITDPKEAELEDVPLEDMKGFLAFERDHPLAAGKACMKKCLIMMPSCHRASMGLVIFDLISAKLRELPLEGFDDRMRGVLNDHSEVPKLTALLVRNSVAIPSDEITRRLLDVLEMTKIKGECHAGLMSTRAELFELLSLSVLGDFLLEEDREGVPPEDIVEGIPDEYAKEIEQMVVRLFLKPVSTRIAMRAIRLCTLAIAVDPSLKANLLSFRAVMLAFVEQYELAKSEFEAALRQHTRSALMALLVVWGPLKSHKCLPDMKAISFPDVFRVLWEACAMKGAFFAFAQLGGSELAARMGVLWGEGWKKIVRQLHKILALCPLLQLDLEESVLHKRLVEEYGVLPEDISLLKARALDEDASAVGELEDVMKGKGVHACVARWFAFFCEVQTVVDGEPPEDPAKTCKSLEESAKEGTELFPDSLLMWIARYISLAVGTEGDPVVRYAGVDEALKKIDGILNAQFFFPPYTQLEQLLPDIRVGSAKRIFGVDWRRGADVACKVYEQDGFFASALLVIQQRAIERAEAFPRGVSEEGILKSIEMAAANRKAVAASCLLKYAGRTLHSSGVLPPFQELDLIKKAPVSELRRAKVVRCGIEFGVAIRRVKFTDIAPDVEKGKLAYRKTTKCIFAGVQEEEVEEEEGEATQQPIIRGVVQPLDRSGFPQLLCNWEDAESGYLCNAWNIRRLSDVLLDKEDDEDFDLLTLRRSVKKLNELAHIIRELHARGIAGLNLRPSAMGIVGSSFSMLGFPSRDVEKRFLTFEGRDGDSSGMVLVPPEGFLHSLLSSSSPENTDSYQFGVLLYVIALNLPATRLLADAIVRDPEDKSEPTGLLDKWLFLQNQQIRPPLSNEHLPPDVAYFLRHQFMNKITPIFAKFEKMILGKDWASNIEKAILEYPWKAELGGPWDFGEASTKAIVAAFNEDFGIGFWRRWPSPDPFKISAFKTSFFNIVLRHFDRNMRPHLDEEWSSPWAKLKAAVLECSLDPHAVVEQVHHNFLRLWRNRLRHLASEKRLTRLIGKCWAHQPNLRPTFKAICEELDLIEFHWRS